jgi:iron(III) transport system substrate-binding protein
MISSAMDLQLLDFTSAPRGPEAGQRPTAFPLLTPGGMTQFAHIRPIRLDPGLLVGLDRMIRASCLCAWDAALTQQ